jgi:hypothetical protein
VAEERQPRPQAHVALVAAGAGVGDKAGHVGAQPVRRLGHVLGPLLRRRQVHQPGAAAHSRSALARLDHLRPVAAGDLHLVVLPAETDADSVMQCKHLTGPLGKLDRVDQP